eukprot:6844621-Pyramimonas_sp.AAC.1
MPIPLAPAIIAAISAVITWKTWAWMLGCRFFPRRNGFVLFVFLPGDARRTPRPWRRAPREKGPRAS